MTDHHHSDAAARRRKLRDMLSQAAKQRKSRSEAFLDELTCELVDVWGGPRGLALDTFNEFKKAAEGGVVRKDILKAIYGLMEKHQRSKPKDVSDLTDEELMNESLPAAMEALSDDDLRELFADADGPEDA